MPRVPSQKKRPAILASSVAALLSLGFFLGVQKAAADEYWDGINTGGSGTANGAGGSGTWDNVTTNWVDVTGTIPQTYDSTTTAHFATTPGTVTLGDNITFTALSFDVDGYVVNPGSLFALTPNTGATITAQAGVGVLINANMVGSGSIILPGPGTVSLAGGGSSFSGGVTLNGGRLNVNSQSALGSGTLTITGGTLGTTVGGGMSFSNPVSVQNSFSIATNVDPTSAANQNLIFGGTIDLGATGPTITGVTPGGQVQFFNTVTGTGGVTFTTSAGVSSDANSPYVAFIYASSVGNTYTGTTTVSGNAILAMQAGTEFAGTIALHGDADVEGNGVLEYIGGAKFNDQIADNATVTVNSPGLTILGGLHFDGFELRDASDTIGSLMGNSSGKVGLGSGTLTVANGGNFAGVIEDGAFGSFGNLTIKGGTLVLSGANTYTGLTTINVGGTLQAGATNTFSKNSAVIIELGGTLDLNNFNQSVGEINDSINGHGAGTINLGSATLTTGNNNIAETTFSGVIQGTGGLTKVGTGTLIIAGNANTFTGPTTINGGGIILTGNSVSPVIVNSNAAFLLESSNLNVAPGGTAVTVNGNGVFDNFNSLTVTGAGSRATQLSGNGALFFNEAGSSVSADTGVFVNNSTGVALVTNFGTITGTGGTSINALNSAGVTVRDFGVFKGQAQFGTGINTVVIATQTPYTPLAAGAGTHDTLSLVGGAEDTLHVTDFPNYEFLNKAGGGMWTLTGTNSFSRGTTVDEGTLNVSGPLVSNTTVNTFGTLSGAGMIVGNVRNFGVLMPGTPTAVITATANPGTLTIHGNYTQDSGGVLSIQVNGAQAGQYSSLAINGHAQLAGGLAINSGGKINLKRGQKVTILSATDGVSGTFSEVSNPFLGGTLVVDKVVYEPYAVQLEGTQGSFLALDSQFHLTFNQKAVARALDSVATDPRAFKLLNYLDSRPLKELPRQLDRIAPEEIASVYRIGVSLANVQTNNVQRRTADLRAGATGFNATDFQTNGGGNFTGGLMGANGPGGAEGKAANPPAPEQTRWGSFIKGVGDFAHVGDTGNARGYDMNTGGITVGADYRLSNRLAVGVTAGYTGTDADLNGRGRVFVNGGKVGVYGTYFDKGFYADAAVTAGANNYATKRDSVQGDAFGHTQGSEVDILVDTGYDWRLDGLTIGPTASFQYTYLGLGGFTEHGSLAPLTYLDQHQSSIRSSFGMHASYDWKVGGVIVRPELMLSWQHEYGDRSYAIDSRLASGSSMFSVADSEIGRDSLLFGAGVSVLWNPRTSTFLYYDADLLQKEYNSQSVNGGLRLNF